MFLIFVVVVSFAQASASSMDTSSIISQYQSGTPILTQTARDQLAQFKVEIDALGARMGMTKFGQAEDLDPDMFQTVKCCYPNVERILPSSLQVNQTTGAVSLTMS